MKMHLKSALAVGFLLTASLPSMAGETLRLAPVRGNVPLSDRSSTAYFEVKRNGEVFQFQDHPVDVLVDEDGKARFERPLFVLKDPGGEWRWQEGYLPILQVGGETELMASGDSLYVREGNRFTVWPSGAATDGSTFEAVRMRMVAYWKDWFARGRTLPSLDARTDAAWKACLVQALCCYAGRHPAYGAGNYHAMPHMAFPPTTLCMVETLVQFRHADEAAEMFLYYLRRFVRADGTIAYYGPSLSEYGGLMWCAAIVAEARPARVPEIASAMRPLVHTVLSMFQKYMPAQKQASDGMLGPNRLLSGSPEADTRGDRREYFHNNFQVLLGLRLVSAVYRANGEKELAAETAGMAEVHERLIRRAYDASRLRLGGVPYEPGQTNLVADIQSDETMTFANYRYYPEMLETGFLSREDAELLCTYREKNNGEWHGMCQFTLPGRGHEVDNWPIAAYARGLLEYGMTDRFERVLKAHLDFYLSDDTYTAYEQIWNEGSPRTPAAPFCVPVQLVLPRLLGWRDSYRTWHERLQSGVPSPGSGCCD